MQRLRDFQPSHLFLLAAALTRQLFRCRFISLMPWQRISLMICASFCRIPYRHSHFRPIAIFFADIASAAAIHDKAFRRRTIRSSCRFAAALRAADEPPIAAELLHFSRQLSEGYFFAEPPFLMMPDAAAAARVFSAAARLLPPPYIIDGCFIFSFR